MTDRSAFAGGDQAYLRDVQYASRDNLDARSSLHQRFSTAELQFPDFVAALVSWPEEADVLECGSGTGRFWTNQRTPRSISLTVTDLSPAMVKAAAATATESGFGSVQRQPCDIQDLPFDDDRFDVVIANHMLYHVPDPDRALAEVRRVLRPEGCFVAATNGYGHMKPINDAIAQVFGSHSERLYEVFGIESGEARLRPHFAAIGWHAYDNKLKVDDPAAAVAYGLSFPPGESANEEQRQRFSEAIGSRVIDRFLTVPTRSGVFICSDPRPSEL